MDDDDDWQNCSLSKLKLEQEAIQFQYLLNDCQKWIETISGKKFKYENDFRKSLEDGVILCELLNALKKGCIRRINKCSGPIAGIDNINLFLKACNQHFGILNTNLFDSTDLEDLNIRGINDSPISIDEQNRRLKKVVNAIHWLSRKTNELGIQVPYYLDLNTQITSTSSSSHNNNTNINNSTSSFDDVFIKTVKSSSTTIITQNQNNTSLLTTVSSSSPSSSSSSSLINNKPKQSSFIQTYITQQKHSRDSSSDSLNLITSASSSTTTSSSSELQQTLSDMPFIYKQPSTHQQQQQQQQNNVNIKKNGINETKQLYINTSQNKNNNNTNKISTGTFTFNNNNNNNLLRKDSIETLDSISSTNSVKLVSTPNNKNSSSSSSSTSSVSSSNAIHNKYDDFETLIPTNMAQNNNNSNNNNNNNHYDDELDFIPSPISSGIPTSPSVSSYLSTSSTTLTPSQQNNSNPTTSSAYIPTRYIDRRVSSSAIQQDPYRFNVNYSEAGSHLARSAQEQLKIAEQIKEAKKEAQRLAQLKKDISINNEDTGEDWQNSVDDWKNRRRAKQKEKNLTQSISIEENDNEYKSKPFEKKIELTRSYTMPVSNSNSNSKPINEINNNNNEQTQQTTTVIKDDEEIIDNNNKIVNYMYIEKFIKIERPIMYNLRGFGFLINNYKSIIDGTICPQVAVVEPNTVAAKADLQVNDHVLAINDQKTKGLNNEQLRKIIRERLSQHSVDLHILRAVPINENASQQEQEQQLSPPKINNNTTTNTTNNNNINNNNNNNINNDNDKKLFVNTSNKVPSPSTIVISTISPKTVINNENINNEQSKKENISNQQQQPIQSQQQMPKFSSSQNLLTHQQFFAPKPFRRSIPNELSSTTIFSTTTIQNENNNNNELSVNTNNNNNNLIMPIISPLQQKQDAPLLPDSEPPPLPKSEPPKMSINNAKNNSTVTAETFEELNINKAILDNIKVIDNWKQEQELLMRQKYEEEQNRIKLSFELNLDKIKEEEIKRREEIAIKYQLEKLKLEKEKLRLQDLEIKQREKDLQEKLKKQDEYKISSFLTSNAINNNNYESNYIKYFEEEKIDDDNKKQIPISLISPSSSILLSTQNNKILSPVKDETDIHEVIKKVQDSMDHLKNDLLQKDMPNYANDVNKLNQNLENTRKKQENVDRIKREQEVLKLERERIELEKENLKKEAELLKQERELILSAASKKQQLFKDTSKVPPPLPSTAAPSFSNSNHNRDLIQDLGYSTMNELNDIELIKNSQLFNTNKQVPMYDFQQQQQPPRPPIQPSPVATTSTARKNVILTLSQTPKPKSQQDFSWVTPAVKINMNDKWMFDELERQQQFGFNQQLRRSVPNLIDTQKQSPTKSSKKPNNNNNNNNNQLTTSNHDLFNKRPSQQLSLSPQRQINNKLRQSTPSLYPSSNQQYLDFPQVPFLPPPPLPPSLNPFQKCATCHNEIGQNSAMVIETLNLAFHLNCFRCSVCGITLGNGKEGTDVRVRGNQLHCNNCFSNDRGLKLSAV